MKKLLLPIFLLFFSASFAQDDLMNMLEGETPKEVQFVTGTFKGTRLINSHTVETPGKSCLEFRISHHFGDLNSGAYQFFGLDGGASIRMGLEYSPDGRFVAAIGRSSYEKTLDGFLKYKLLRQTDNDAMPITMTLFAGMYYTTLRDANAAITGIDRYHYPSNRMSYAYQLLVSRKFGDRFSMQLSPTMVHYNLVDSITDKNDIFALGFLGRYKFSKRAAIDLEYIWRINDYSTQTYYDGVGIGLEIETGGHVFQILFTNSVGMIEPQFIARNTTKWQNFGLKLGFNISRMFVL